MSNFETLREDLLELREDQKDTARSCSIMATTTAKLDREIFGNGRPGLVSVMTEVQTTQKMMLKAVWLVGGAVVTVGLGIIGALLMG
jgi:hypothetical protein